MDTLLKTTIENNEAAAKLRLTRAFFEILAVAVFQKMSTEVVLELKKLVELSAREEWGQSALISWEDIPTVGLEGIEHVLSTDKTFKERLRLCTGGAQ